MDSQLLPVSLTAPLRVPPKVLEKLRAIAMRHHGFRSQTLFCQQRADAIRGDIQRAEAVEKRAAELLVHYRTSPDHLKKRTDELEALRAEIQALRDERQRQQTEASRFNALSAPMQQLINGVCRQLACRPEDLGLVYDETPVVGTVIR